MCDYPPSCDYGTIIEGTDATKDALRMFCDHKGKFCDELELTDCRMYQEELQEQEQNVDG
jgi:hypothetical protein